MADSKITALASIGTGTDPANDPLVIVDVSDVSPSGMSATGTTKKVTLNNLLACSPTATLASATISGDLTVNTNVLKVDTTNDRVGIGTASPSSILHISNTAAATRITITDDTTNGRSGYIESNYSDALVIGTTSGVRAIRFSPDNKVCHLIEPSGTFTWYDGAGGTRMTLNSTGLGVGATPSYKLDVEKTSDGTVGYFRRIGATINPALTLYCNETGNTVGFGTDYAGATSPAITFTTAGAERVRIDSSGNVGVGVTPSALTNVIRLEIGGALSSNLTLRSTSTSTAARNWMVGANVNAFGDFVIRQGNSQGAEPNSGTDRLVIDASGNLLVGTTTNVNSSRVFIRNGSAANPTLALQGVTGDVNQAGLLVGKFDNNSTTSQILVRFTINDNAAGSGQINANGASQAAFGSYSDSRLKENIISLPSQLANILSLRPVEFDYKDGSGHQIGFVAQEMQEVYSDAVGEQNGFLTVTGWSKTEARLVSAIKELAAKVQALEAKLA